MKEIKQIKKMEILSSMSLSKNGIRIYSYLDINDMSDEIGEELIYSYKDLRYNILEHIIPLKKGTSLGQQIKEKDYILNKKDPAVLETLEEINNLKKFVDELHKDFIDKMQ